MIRIYDISELVDDELDDALENKSAPGPKGTAHLLNEVDVHSQPVTSLQLWLRESKDMEPWIVSASLDGTLRRWKLAGEYPMLTRSPDWFAQVLHISDIIERISASPQLASAMAAAPARPQEPQLTIDEERELAELMDDED